MRTTTARRARAALVIAAVGVLLAGCVSIPDSGPVRPVEEGRADQVAPARITPAGPTDGAEPREIVTGFLQAMMSSPVRYDIARRFLTDDAATAWNPWSAVTVYSQSSVAEPETSGDSRADIDVDLVREAVLSDQGRVAVPPTREQRFGVPLVKVDGQWRIAEAPAGAFITESFFESYYDTLNAYYFDAAGRQLVAEPVHLPDDENRATYLVASLLKGVQGAIGGQARTYLPDSWRLDGPVEIDPSGVATVRVDGSDSGLDISSRERLSAQLVWTLRQLPSVSGVEIRVGDRPLALPDTPNVQRLETWDEYDPAAERSTQLFALREGRLIVVGRASTSPFAGVWGRDPVRAQDFRVDLDAERIALVTDDRTVVRVSPLSTERELTPVRSGTDLLRPSWDAAGRLWTVDRTARGSTLHVGPATEPGALVDLGPLARTRITGFELSADGARFVAVGEADGRAALYVGAVSYDDDGKVVAGLVSIDEVSLPAETGTPLSAAWRSTTSVAVLAQASRRAPEVSIAAVDSSSAVTGSVRVGLLATDDARQVLSPGLLTAPVYVIDGRGVLWSQTSDGRWRQAGDDPVTVAGFAG